MLRLPHQLQDDMSFEDLIYNNNLHSYNAIPLIMLCRDLSKNNFDPSEAPIWLTTLPSLTTL
jgi:hypothetical protein